MERLTLEAELLEKLENEIEQLKLSTLRSCPNCGMSRPKRYHRSTQTPRVKPTTTVIIPQVVQTKDDIETRLQKLTEKVDRVSYKTTGILRRSYQLQDNSKLLGYEMDRILK